MKYLIILFALFTFSCSSQTISLETAANCHINRNCPNFNYVKDINNSLNKYVGIWNGNYNGNFYQLNFIKKEYVGEDIKDDRLIGRMQIKNSTGKILYNTLSESNDLKTKFSGINFQPNLKAYMVYFVGNKTDCIDYGTVYLIINPSTPNKMTIDFLPDNDIVIEGKCTNSFVPTLPYRKTITLIKQ